MAENNVVSMTATTTLPAYSGPTNNLRGVDDDTPLTQLGSEGDTFYVLGNKNSHFGFHKYTGEEMAARKAYLLVPGTHPRRRSQGPGR